MANLKFSESFMCTFSGFLLLLPFLCSFKDGYASEVYKTNKSHHLEAKYLLQSGTCNQTFKGERRPSLKIVHRYGPCIQLLNQGQTVKTVSQEEMLIQDQRRVDSIHGRLLGTSSGNFSEMKSTLKARSGVALGTGNYVVSVGLGTPQKQFTLEFDTGSDITWTQCQPCLGYCHPQSGPIFSPTQSTSYKNISCSSPLCNLIQDSGGFKNCSRSGRCIYLLVYGDLSISSGFLATETLTLTSSDKFQGFSFGCGQYNKGLFGQTSGILGLGRGQLSLVSQTSQKYKKIFSYCLPKTQTSTGQLNFGGPIPTNTKFTKLSTTSKTPSFYHVDITGITVKGKTLPIDQSVFSTAGAIIDSGTVITRLPPKAYSVLSSTFQELMKGYPRAQPVGSTLDTCYDFSGNETILVPEIGVVFQGGLEVKMELEGIFSVVGLNKVCLAFAGNKRDTDVAIFGNQQQKGYEVVYDGVMGRVGFAPGLCD